MQHRYATTQDQLQNIRSDFELSQLKVGQLERKVEHLHMKLETQDSLMSSLQQKNKILQFQNSSTREELIILRGEFEESQTTTWYTKQELQTCFTKLTELRNELQSKQGVRESSLFQTSYKRLVAHPKYGKVSTSSDGTTIEIPEPCLNVVEMVFMDSLKTIFNLTKGRPLNTSISFEMESQMSDITDTYMNTILYDLMA